MIFLQPGFFKIIYCCLGNFEWQGWVVSKIKAPLSPQRLRAEAFTPAGAEHVHPNLAIQTHSCHPNPRLIPGHDRLMEMVWEGKRGEAGRDQLKTQTCTNTVRLWQATRTIPLTSLRAADKAAWITTVSHYLSQALLTFSYEYMTY